MMKNVLIRVDTITEMLQLHSQGDKQYNGEQLLDLYMHHTKCNDE